MSAPTVIKVSGVDPYEIVIGRALLSEVAVALGDKVRKVLVVHPVALTASAELLRESLVADGYEQPHHARDGGQGRIVLRRLRERVSRS